MSESSGYFVAAGEVFEPQAVAASQWSSDQVVGPALCGLLARELENRHGGGGLVPVRLTVDLFKPARMHRLAVTTRIVREGKRIRLADATVMQDEAPVARAALVFLRPAEQPPGVVWTRDHEPVPPDPGMAPPGHVPLWSSDASGNWSAIPSGHEDSSRKRTWQRPLDVLAGEAGSPFVRAAMVGEQTSMVTNWSDLGVAFINTDLTLALARMPIGPDIGVEADNHLGGNGIAVGSATLFDRHGVFGTGLITAVANAGRRITAGRLDEVVGVAGWGAGF
ncbi:acyl-CoA thioesterase domain-containing protein [Nocardia terpenica]|uniref:acyl-CoA thioesterase domain-containing protein n=1 Tax=Nocardia terpenica TaxID=455432 RepID=UPI002FDFFC5B